MTTESERTTSTASIGPAASVTRAKTASAMPSPTIAPSPQNRPDPSPDALCRRSESIKTPARMRSISPAWPGVTLSPNRATATITVTASQAEAALVTTDTGPRCRPV